MSDERLLAFASALSDALKSGLPPAATLRSLAPLHGAGLTAAAEKVSAGGTLHESLGPEWPPLLHALVRAGEEAGKLDAFLDRYAAFLRTRIDFRRRLSRAALYPGFTLALAAVLFVLFSAEVAPRLLQPLLDAGVPPPEGALRVIKAGRAIMERRWLILGGLAAAFLLGRAVLSSGPARRVAALAGHWLPGFRYALEESRQSELNATVSLLLAAGLRPRQLLELLAQCFAEDPVTRHRCERAGALTAEGRGLAESLAPCLGPEDRLAWENAEKAGRLDSALERLAASHGEKHAHRLKVLANAFQLGAVCALAPLCFSLVLWVLYPSLSLLKQGVAGPEGGLYRAVPEPSRDGLPPALSMPTGGSHARGFNESHAKGVVDFMGSHAAPADGGQKKMNAPKLQDRPMRKPSFRKIEATPVESGLR